MHDGGLQQAQVLLLVPPRRDILEIDRHPFGRGIHTDLQPQPGALVERLEHNKPPLLRRPAKLRGERAGLPFLAHLPDRASQVLGQGALQQPVRVTVAIGEAEIVIQGEQRLADAFNHAVQPRARQPQLQRGHHLPRQHVERLLLHLRQAPGPRVQHAQRSQRQALARKQRRTGIEPQRRRASDQRVIFEPRLQAHIRHLQQARLQQQFAGGGIFQRHLAPVQSRGRFAPQALPVHQADQRHRGLAQPGGQPGDVIKLSLRRRIQHAIAPQCGEARGFVGGRRMGCHGLP